MLTKGNFVEDLHEQVEHALCSGASKTPSIVIGAWAITEYTCHCCSGRLPEVQGMIHPRPLHVSDLVNVEVACLKLVTGPSIQKLKEVLVVDLGQAVDLGVGINFWAWVTFTEAGIVSAVGSIRFGHRVLIDTSFGLPFAPRTGNLTLISQFKHGQYSPCRSFCQNAWICNWSITNLSPHNKT